MKTNGLKVLAVAVTLLAFAAIAATDAPSRELVEKVMRSYWDKDKSQSTPKSVLTLNDVRFGKAYKATAQEVQVEGIPQGATVTPLVIDFTVRTYYTGETHARRRVREATIYKDKMNDWAIMTGSGKGEDTTTKE